MSFLSHFGNNFLFKLENLYCISMTYEDIVRFGGDCEVHSLRSQVVLRNCWRSCRSRRNQRVHRDEQRGAGCQEYLSPTKYV